MSPRITLVVNFISIFLTSILVGIICGLSVSPIVSQIIGVILGILVTAVSFLTGMEEIKAKVFNKVNAFPLFLLTLGLSIGLYVGIQVRVHNMLGSNYDSEIDYWASKTGQPKEEIAKLIFARELSTEASGEPNMSTDGVLKSTDIAECTTFCAYEGENLSKELHATNDPVVKKMVDKLSEEEAAKAVKVLCNCK
jgi:hypothetical protein